MLKKVFLYADGSCKGNPGPGGWGAVLIYNQHKKELCGGEPNSTNNRMELMAVIKGLDALKWKCDVTVFTDSKYVIDGMTKWINGWKSNGWRTAKKEPVKNMALWQWVEDIASRHVMTWEWVKGHSGNSNNELADKLANRGCILNDKSIISREVDNPQYYRNEYSF